MFMFTQYCFGVVISWDDL